MVMSVTTRRERRERELRRRQREKHGGHTPSPRGGGGRGVIIGVGIIVLFIVALLGLRQAGILTTAPAPSPTPTPSALPSASPVAADDPARGIQDPDYSNAHVSQGTPVDYAQLPPTSGSHWPQPAAPVKAGVYTQQVPFEATVHNLEHGGIVIVYNGLSADEVTKLNDFVKSAIAGQYKKVLDEPYAGLTRAKVVVTAWRWHLDLQTVDTTAIQKFIQVHYNSTDAPEPGASW